jgi:hypothetical protein
MAEISLRSSFTTLNNLETADVTVDCCVVAMRFGLLRA